MCFYHKKIKEHPFLGARQQTTLVEVCAQCPLLLCRCLHSRAISKVESAKFAYGFEDEVLEVKDDPSVWSRETGN